MPFVSDWQGLDPAGGQEAKGDCISGQDWSGEKQTLPSGSGSLISAAKDRGKLEGRTVFS